MKNGMWAMKAVLVAGVIVGAMALMGAGGAAQGGSDIGGTSIGGTAAVGHAIGLVKGDPFTGSWTITVTADDSMTGKGFDDVLTFHGDQFVSAELTKRGFASCQYDEATTPMGVAQFDAKPHSDQQGDAAWHGEVAGDQLTGTMIWTKKDGTVVNYSFSGQKKQ